MDSDGKGRRYHRQLVRGAVVNTLGLVAKLVHPLLFLVLTWLFGPTLMGGYFLAISIGEIVSGLIASGFVDATTIYASHHADAEEGDAEAARSLYQVLGNGFAATLAVSLLVVLAAVLGSQALVEALYPDTPELAPALVLLGLSMPLLAFSQVAIAATKARMRMEYDAAILGFSLPMLLLGTSVVVWWLDGGLVGLMAAHLVTQVLVAAASGWALARHFDLGRLARTTLRPVPHRPTLVFAVPQSLNMTFNKYITRLDVIMLAAFGVGAVQVAFYATAALLVSNLRQIKIVFSTSLAPVAARHHGAGERSDFEAVLGRVSRWTTTLIVPALILTVVLRDDIMRFVDEAYVGDTTFMLLLMIPPFLSCAFGLAGNCVTYCGHSRWTLFNSVVVAVLNTVFNVVFIPRWGLLGAALATALAAGLISVLQLVELRLLEGVGLRWREVYKPHLGFALVAAAVALMWDPAALPGLGLRIGVAFALVGAFAVLMLLMRHDELTQILRRTAA
ncbi:MAG: lipopolysaccharide biosynthesis protein [Myxococcota bacterium]